MRKFIPYILIVLILVGTFAPMMNVNAQGTPPAGTSPSTTTDPVKFTDKDVTVYPFLTGCGVIGSSSIGGCVQGLTYFLFVSIPSFLLSIAAIMFNYMAALTLSDTMYRASFIQTIWTIVRDFANVFFILMLLYAALRTILDIGHGNEKKIIVNVIIMALLVNFSLFTTRIVIDSSNIMALIFYNKIDVQKIQSYTPVSDPGKTTVPEKDMSGALISTFNINTFFRNIATSMDKTQRPVNQVCYFGTGISIIAPIPCIPKYDASTVAPSAFTDTWRIVSLMVAFGIIIYLLTYAFFVAGLAFFGRMITLMMLMIVSPFAFVSFAIPALRKMDTIGFTSWIHKLIETSFVSAIFMFIVYIVSQIMNSNAFTATANGNDKSDMTQTLILILVPSLLIAIMLIKGASYAKKASGEFTGAVIGGAKVVGALAVGGAALGLAGVGRGLIGGTAKAVQGSDVSRKNAYTFKDVQKKWSTMNKANPFAYLGLASTAISSVPKAISGIAAAGIHKVPGELTPTVSATGGGLRRKTLGEHMQTQEEAYSHKTHATHILDAKMKQEYGSQPGYEDKKYKDLIEPEQEIVRGEVEKDEMSKFIYGKLFKDLEAPQAQEVQNLHSAGNKAIDNGHGKTIGYGTALNDVRDGSGVQKFTAPGVPLVGKQFKSDFLVDMSKANPVIGEFVQAMRKASYDIRKLPDMSAKSGGLAPMLSVGAIALFAAGVRAGIKQGAGVEHYGTPQRNVFKDFGNTITEAFKNVKITIKQKEHGGKTVHEKEVKSVGH